MKSILSKYSRQNYFYLLLTIFFSLISCVSFAETPVDGSAIKIIGNQIVKKPLVYKNVTLDFRKGNIRANESIDIEDSTIYVTISPSNPQFISLDGGTLTLKNNRIIVSTNDIAQTPKDQALYYLIHIVQGGATILNNTFEIDKFYTVGFLITNENIKTANITVRSNIVRNFHGGLYLINSDSAQIMGNKFSNVSFSNLFTMGNGSRIENNTFKFPGNLNLGDGIDLLNSNNVVLINNSILSSASYGITAVGCQNVTINSNKISDSRSHGIYITTSLNPDTMKDPYFAKLFAHYPVKNLNNSNIKVLNNYLSQNRFGIAGDNVDDLTVQYNTFIQKFGDDAARLFWTDNSKLLVNITNLDWSGNLYKEAYTQEVPGDNTKSSKFIAFPASGGIFIE